MRILINDYGGHPFPAQLSRQLARRHTVLHTNCQSYVSGKGALGRVETDPAALTFVPLDLGAPFAKHSIVRRFRQERGYARLLISEARHFRPDVVISATMPLFGQEMLLRWARRSRVAFVFWLQDLTSVAMNAELARRFGRGSRPLRAYLTALEAHLLRSSDAIVAISEDFLPTLSGWRVAAHKTSVIPNWAPLDEIPQLPRVNRWSKEHGVADKFTFLYTGTLGLKHDPELLVQLALTLAFKRLIDIGAATVGLIASAPIALLVAAAILLEDGRPILFRQERVGLHGRRFRVVKFRTMHHDAEQSLAELMTRNEVRGQAFKITNDPRVTRVGRFLRRTSLDELPQLWNVLLGEMSLVGPRPPCRPR